MSEREISVRLVAESTEPVTCSHGLRVLPDVAWADVGALDLLVLPGGSTRPCSRTRASSGACAS